MQTYTHTPSAKLVSKIPVPKYLRGPDKAAILVVTNAQVHEFHFANDKKIALSKDNPIKARFFLVQNPEDKTKTPYLTTFWHGASDSTALREKELEMIHRQAMEIRHYVKEEFGVTIEDHFINADTNENFLSLNIEKKAGESANYHFNIQEAAVKLLTTTPLGTVYEPDAVNQSESYIGEESKNTAVLVKSMPVDLILPKGTMDKGRGAIPCKIEPQDDKKVEAKKSDSEKYSEERQKKLAAKASEFKKALQDEKKQTADATSNVSPAIKDKKQRKQSLRTQPQRNKAYYENSFDATTNAQMEKEKKMISGDSKVISSQYHFEEYEISVNELKKDSLPDNKSTGPKRRHSQYVLENPIYPEAPKTGSKATQTAIKNLQKNINVLERDLARAKIVLSEDESKLSAMIKAYESRDNASTSAETKQASSGETLAANSTDSLVQEEIHIAIKSREIKAIAKVKSEVETKDEAAKKISKLLVEKNAELHHLKSLEKSNATQVTFKPEKKEEGIAQNVDIADAEESAITKAADLTEKLKKEAETGYRRKPFGKGSAQPLRSGNFGTDLTKLEDHYPSQSNYGPQTNNIEHQVRGGTPTAGPKKIQSPEGIFLPKYIKDPKERNKRGVDLTHKFLEIIYDKVGVPNDVVVDTRTAKSTAAVSEDNEDYLGRFLGAEIAKNGIVDQLEVKEKKTELLVNILLECSKEALDSEEYEQFTAMMTATHQTKVANLMVTFLNRESPDFKLESKATVEYLKDGKQPFEKLVQLFMQNLESACDAGFKMINRESMQGPEIVDDINAATMVKSAMKSDTVTTSILSLENKGEAPALGSSNESKLRIVLKGATETGGGDKAPRYEAKTRAGLLSHEKGYIPEWKKMLDDYITKRQADSRYNVRDRVTFSWDLKRRKAMVDGLKAQMDEYAKVITMEGEKGEIALREGILKKVRELKNGIHGVDFKRCLNEIEYQLKNYEVETNKVGKEQTILDPVFFVKNAREEYQADYKIAQSIKNNPFQFCNLAVKKLFEYGDKCQDGLRQQACHLVSAEAISLLKEMARRHAEKVRVDQQVSQDKSMNGEQKALAQINSDKDFIKELEEYKHQFTTNLHIQDAMMADRRADSWGVSAKKCSLGLFSRTSTRESLISDIEKTFNKAVATITPATPVEPKAAARLR